MSTITTTHQVEEPDRALDQVELARAVLSELHSLVESARVMNKLPGTSTHVDCLIDLACRHADEWAAHFERQRDLFRLQEEPAEGDKA